MQTLTSTPRHTPPKSCRTLRETPKSILKKRKLIDRHVKLDSPYDGLDYMDTSSPLNHTYGNADQEMDNARLRKILGRTPQSQRRRTAGKRTPLSQRRRGTRGRTPQSQRRLATPVRRRSLRLLQDPGNLRTTPQSMDVTPKSRSVLLSTGPKVRLFGTGV